MPNKLNTLALRDLLDSGYLNLFLFPTEQCNFRCTYCYEDFELGQMPPEVVVGVERLLEARAPELHSLVISWFGGEPLLAKPILLRIGTQATVMSTRYGFNYRATATTNGYLLDRTTVTELYESGVNGYQISLDGPPEVHNRTRKMAAGRGSFDRIWRNLVAVQSLDYSDLDIVLRMHYTPESVRELGPLIEMINGQFADDTRFKVFFKEVSHLGGPNDRNFKVFTAAAAAEAKRFLEEQLAQSSQRATLLDETGINVCYAARPNSLAIRSNGTVAKCTVALNEPVNSIGRLTPEGRLEIDQDKLRFWIRGIASGDAAELECPMHGLTNTRTLKDSQVMLPSPTFPARIN